MHFLGRSWNSLFWKFETWNRCLLRKKQKYRIGLKAGKWTFWESFQDQVNEPDRRMHLNWNTSPFAMVWNSLWDLPISSALLLWSASAFFSGKELYTSAISRKIKRAQHASLTEISHLLETGKVESDCVVIFVK